MKELVSFTSMLAGVLLVILPRLVLPACEYEGYARMHCTDTALAEYVIGAVLIAAGGMTLGSKRAWAPLAGAALSCLLLAAAWTMPEIYGYCANRKMPCNYGMVPGIRFLSVTALIVQIAALAFLVRNARKR